MASSASLGERAVILAPAPLSTKTSRLLSSAGVHCLCARDMANLGASLAEGAGLAIIAEEAFNESPRSLLKDFIDQQPSWSDLPIVMLTATAITNTTPVGHPLGNLTLLFTPYQQAQLVQLAQAALRSRRRQYLARDQLRDLQQSLDARSATQQSEALALHQTRKMEAIGQLAGGMAHDFNNLLTSIGGSFELLDRRLKQGRSDGVEGILRMGRQAVSRAARLTHRLLAFSSRQSLHSQCIDLPQLLLTERLESVLTQGVTLQVKLAPDLWAVQADQIQLQEAIDSLLQNACEAMPSGGLLRIEASNVHAQSKRLPAAGLNVGDYACLTIIDEGQGMSESTLEHAFEPFFSTKPVGQGIGLGLSMVYGFSKQSQGHVVLRSQIGQGTRVDLFMPRHRSQAPSQKRTLAAALPADGRNVLLVEDDPDVRNLLCQTLLEDGFSCRSVRDANEALQVLRSAEQVDLLVSDVGLPGMNGRQLAEIARTLRPHLPVLFITGYAETAAAREAFLGPGMQLICKPFALKQLQVQVAQMLGSGR
ncbi:response regulator [Pseudomonas plecoglossicida]|uniref:response regulator n=1 Tax=Pseudomonas plecoglossicida TaxID=70775 RepID=UPI003D1C903C